MTQVVMQAGAQLAVAIPEEEGADEVDAIGGGDLLLEGEADAALAAGVDVEAGFRERQLGALGRAAVGARDGAEDFREDPVIGEDDELRLLEGASDCLDEVVGDGDLGLGALVVGDGFEGAGQEVREVAGEDSGGLGLAEGRASLGAGDRGKKGVHTLGQGELVEAGLWRLVAHGRGERYQVC